MIVILSPFNTHPKSLLLSHSSQQSQSRTNTEVIAPLFKWILRAGVLHLVFAALHALGKTIDGRGLNTCAIESGIYTSATLQSIYSGKAHKRDVQYHIVTRLAIMMLRFKDNFSVITLDLSMCSALL